MKKIVISGLLFLSGFFIANPAEADYHRYSTKDVNAAMHVAKVLTVEAFDGGRLIVVVNRENAIFPVDNKHLLLEVLEKIKSLNYPGEVTLVEES